MYSCIVDKLITTNYNKRSIACPSIGEQYIKSDFKCIL